MRMIHNFKPLVIRINDIGRAEAAKYDAMGCKPQDAENQVFPERILPRITVETLHHGTKQFLMFMGAQLASSVAEAYHENKTVENFLRDPTAPDTDIARVSIEDLRPAPCKATVDFYEIRFKFSFPITGGGAAF
jgi:type IV secretion system protein VirB5